MENSVAATTRARICFFIGGWRIASGDDTPGEVREVAVRLEVQGDSRDGFVLLMSPAGGFTADNWYPTREEALTAAHELFGVTREAFRPSGAPATP